MRNRERLNKAKETSAQLEALRSGGRRAISRCLTAIETDFIKIAPLLDAAHAAVPQARCLGVTGPPGVGKSTLLAGLTCQWRKRGERVAIIPVDPSSPWSGGAFLGDRLRFHRCAGEYNKKNGGDPGLFIRSMAARRALGGVSHLTLPVLVLLSALYDRVAVETVGVGQSEIAIRGLVPTVLFCVQPGAGDMIQCMKAGIIEIPDIVVVTKADMGAAAFRTVDDLQAAFAARGCTAPYIHTVSAKTEQGMMDLLAVIDRIQENQVQKACITDKTIADWSYRCLADHILAQRRRYMGSISSFTGLVLEIEAQGHKNLFNSLK